jgi:hypothetical protein
VERLGHKPLSGPSADDDEQDRRRRNVTSVAGLAAVWQDPAGQCKIPLAHLGIWGQNLDTESSQSSQEMARILISGSRSQDLENQDLGNLRVFVFGSHPPLWITAILSHSFPLSQGAHSFPLSKGALGRSSSFLHMGVLSRCLQRHF